MQFLTTLWMKVIAPEIFEMRVPRDLLPFILPDMSSGTFDNMETADIDTSSPATPGDHCEPVSEGSSLTETTCPPVSPLHDVSSHTQDEIHVAEALLNVCKAPTCAIPSVYYNQDSGLTFFPWGGVTRTGISLTNTCPLDNWLMLFQALVKSGKVNLADLPESGHIIASALQLIDSGHYADAKLVVLQSLVPQPQVVSGTMDLYGNESDFFLPLLNPYLMSTSPQLAAQLHVQVKYIQFSQHQ